MIRLTALTIFTIASLFGCGAERFSWNERTTVTVQTPNGIVTGTSVIEFRAAWCEDGCGFPARSYEWDFTGEAVVVEVLPDRYLFVLPQIFLASADRYAPDLFGRIENTGDRLRTARAIEDVIEVPSEYYPDMLTFLEWGDRNSLREVTADNISEVFDEGVEIVSITLEITRDQVSVPRIAALLQFTCTDFWPLRIPTDGVIGHRNITNSDFGRSLQVCDFDEF